MTIGNTTSPDQEEQVQNQEAEYDPSNVLNRSEGEENAYNISFWTVSQSQLGSKASAQADEVHYRIEEDNPALLLKADNLLKCLKREFGLTGLERYEGEAFEIVIGATEVSNGLSTAKESKKQIDCTIVEPESIELMPVVEEFIQLANSEL